MPLGSQLHQPGQRLQVRLSQRVHRKEVPDKGGPLRRQRVCQRRVCGQALQVSYYYDIRGVIIAPHRVPITFIVEFGNQISEMTIFCQNHQCSKHQIHFIHQTFGNQSLATIFVNIW